MKKFDESESGQSLILMTLCMTVVVGILGLAVDVGFLFHTKQNAQIAADAAAVAAAQDYLYNASVSAAQTQGQSASTANGYTNGTGGVTVTINVPPASGPVAGVASYAEAIVSVPNSLSFMRVLGSTSATVTARAVAGSPSTASACIFLLGTSGTDLDLQGSYDIEAPTCGIVENSPANNAVKVTGNGGTVNAAYLDATGSPVNIHSTTPTPITSNAAAVTDPYANKTMPDNSSCTTTVTTNNLTIDSSNVASYQGTAGGVLCFTKSVTLGSSGTTTNFNGFAGGTVYLFQSGVTVATGATVNMGSATYNSTTQTFSNTLGAMMEITGGTLDQKSNSNLSLYAPANNTLPWNGIALMQTTNTQLQVVFGSNNEVIDGYIYAPTADVFLQDSGGGINAVGIVSKSMTVKTGQLGIYSYDRANASTSGNRTIVLVE